MSVDRQFCEDQMLMKMAELGRKPTHDEILQDSRMPKGSDFAFYWSSLDGAISKIWSKYLAQSGVKPVARPKTLKMRERVAQEEKVTHLEEGVEEMTEDFVTGESIAEVGEDSTTRLPVLDGSVTEPTDEGGNANYYFRQEEIVKKEVGHSRQHGPYTLVELKVAMQRVQEYFGLPADTIPGQIQINQASKEIGTPCYGAFSHMLGPKKQWLQVLNGVEPEETKATSDITEVVMPVRVVQPGGKTDVLTTSEMVELDESVKPDTTEAGGQIELETAASGSTEVKTADIDESAEVKSVEETTICNLTLCAAQFDVVLNGQKMRFVIDFGKE